MGKKMLKLRQSVVSALISFLMVLNIFTPFIKTAVIADDNYNNFANYVTGVDVSNPSGTNHSGTFYDGDTISLFLSYTFEPNTLREGNLEFKYQLPYEDLTLLSGGLNQGNIISDSADFQGPDNYPGTYNINFSTGEVTFIFTEKFRQYNDGTAINDKGENVEAQALSGTFEFSAEANAKNTGSDVKFSFPGQATNVTYKLIPNSQQVSTNVTKSSEAEGNRIKHTVTITGGEYGTRGPVTIDDTLDGGYNDEPRDANSIQYIDPATAQITVTPNLGSLSVKSDGSGIEGTLPKLNGGESYTITYYSEYNTNTLNGTSYVKNNIKVTSEDDDHNKTSSDESKRESQYAVSYNMVSKNGVYDPSTGAVNYTITINTENQNLNGYTIKDVMQLAAIDGSFDSSKVQNMTVTSSGTSITSSNVASIFTDSGLTINSDDTNTYTISYSYQLDSANAAESRNITNTVNVDNDVTNHHYTTGPINTGIGGADFQSKSPVSNVPATVDGVDGYNLTWFVTVKNPIATTIPAGSYTDDFFKADYPQQNDVQHYLTSPIEKPSGVTSIQYYSADGTLQNEFPSDGKAYGIRITYDSLAKDATVTTTYTTFVPKTNITENNTDFYAQNVAKYYRTSTSNPESDSVNHTVKNTSSFTKRTLDSSNNYHSSSEPIDGFEYSDTNNSIKYVLTINKTEDSSLSGYYTITDTLPTGTSITGDVVFYNNNHWNNPVYNLESVAGTGTHSYYEVNGSDVVFHIPYSEFISNDIEIVYSLLLPSTEPDTSNEHVANFVNSAVGSDGTTASVSQNVTYPSGSNEDPTPEAEPISDKICLNLTDGSNVIDLSNSSERSVDISYAVIINPTADDADMNSTTDTISLSDTLEVESIAVKNVELSSINLFEYDANATNNCGNDVTVSKLFSSSVNQSISGENLKTVLSVTVPDEYACVLVYTYSFTFASKPEGAIKNTASLVGGSSSKESNISYKISTSGATAAMFPTVNMYKVSQGNMALKLEGASFEFQYFDVTNKTWNTVTNASNVPVGLTGVSIVGQVSGAEAKYISNTNTLYLNSDVLYRVREVTAPSGYVAGEVFYIVLGAGNNGNLIGDRNYQELVNHMATTIAAAKEVGNFDENKVKYFLSNSNLYVGNEVNTTSLMINKIWKDTDGNAYTDESLSSTVELYEVAYNNSVKVTINHVDDNGEVNITSFEVEEGTPVTVTVQGPSYNFFNNPTWSVNGNVEVATHEVKGNINYATYTFTPSENTILNFKSGLWNNNGASIISLTSLSATVPTSVSTNLVATYTLNNSNNWQVVVNEGINPNTFYYIKEIAPSTGYDVFYSATGTRIQTIDDFRATVSGGTLTVTNVSDAVVPATTSVTVSKVWEDGDNVDGIRPSSVTIALKADGEQKGTITLSAANNWTYTWNDLDKYSAGEEIEYTVEETGTVTGYTPTITGDVATGFVVTNTHTPDKTSIVVKKVWDDGNDVDGIRPESINLVLLADGVEVNTVSIDARMSSDDNTWEFTYFNLPKNSAGKPIVYTIVEQDEITGYISTVSNDGLVVTNTHTPDTTEVVATKVWDDGDNVDGIRPAALTLTLYADGVEVTDVDPVVTESADGNTWTYTWSDLPKNAAGTAIVYTVEEAEANVPTGYTSSQTGNEITNSHTPDTTEFVATKVWDDADNVDSLRPASLALTLYADGVEVTGVTPVVTKSADGNTWTYTWSNLPKNSAGVAIVYTVEEAEANVPTGYTPSQTGNEITNSHTPIPNNLTITKTFSDGKTDVTGVKFELRTNATAAGTEFVQVSGTQNFAYPATINPGTYYIVETATPDGYVAVDPITVVVAADKTISVVGSVEGVTVTGANSTAMNVAIVNKAVTVTPTPTPEVPTPTPSVPTPTPEVPTPTPSVPTPTPDTGIATPTPTATPTPGSTTGSGTTSTVSTGEAASYNAYIAIALIGLGVFVLVVRRRAYRREE